MASWSQFTSSDVELGAIATQRILDQGLVLVGTLRRNGWPRISPVEPLVVDGELYLGMMWQSKKALDLLGDPRCVVHSLVTEKDGSEGDVKVYANAREVAEAAEVERFCKALFSHIGWQPPGDFHLFRLEITEVGFFRSAGGAHDVRTWRPQ